MKATIDLFPQGIIDQSFLVKVREWAGEVIEKIEPRAAQDPISIYLWEKALKAYVRKVLETPHKNFQDRLERTALGLINHFAS